MREFKCSPFADDIVDLDDPETYKYLPNSIDELNNKMLQEIGYSLCYMDFWHPDVFFKERGDKEKPNWGYEQRQRVYKLIENFTKNRNDNWKNIMWFKEQVFLFQDEIENMC